MRNIVLIFVSVFVIMTAGAWSILWYVQGVQARHAIEQFVASVNARQPLLTYDSIDLSGFPANVNVSIIRPHLKGRLDTLFPHAVASRPQWDMDTLLDGRITFGINALSSHYTMHISGNWQDNMRISNQPYATISETPADTRCEMQVERNLNPLASLWSFQLPETDLQVFLKTVRLLDCSSPGYGLIDATSHAVLMHSGPQRWYFTSDPQKDRRKLRVFIHSADLEITPAGNQIITAMMQVISPISAMPANFDSYGKQNMDVDLSYDAPEMLKMPLGATPIDIQLAKLELHNNLYNTSATFHYANGPAAAGRATQITWHAGSQFDEAYDTLLQNALTSTIAQIYSFESQAPDAPNKLSQRYRQDDLVTVLRPALPALHTLGALTMAGDMSAQGNEDLSAADFHINGLELSATPYGITGEGNAKSEKTLRIPAGDLTLTCRNCLSMVDDMGAYALRLRRAAVILAPDKMDPTPPDTSRIDGLKSFLSALAPAGNDGKTFAYHIVSDGSMLSVNGKSTQEVMGLYQQFLAKKP